MGEGGVDVGGACLVGGDVVVRFVFGGDMQSQVIQRELGGEGDVLWDIGGERGDIKRGKGI